MSLSIRPVESPNESQKYKEGRYILEKAVLIDRTAKTAGAASGTGSESGCVVKMEEEEDDGAIQWDSEDDEDEEDDDDGEEEEGESGEGE